MKCYQCGAENKEGSLFCKNCGARMDMSASASVPVQTSAPVFCPNCGKRFIRGEAFCDECGTDLNSGVIPEFESKKRGGKFIKILAVLIGVGIVGAVAVFGKSFIMDHLPGVGEKTKETKLLYVADRSIWLANLKSKKDPVEVTDSFIKDNDVYNSGVMTSSLLTKDGKYIYYFEDYDGDDAKLFRVATNKAGKKDAAVAIDSKVSSFKVLDNGNCLYIKKDALYYYNGKKDSVKIASDVYNTYDTDPECKYVYWNEQRTGDTGRTYYLQDLTMKNDKVRLVKDASNFYANKELTRFFAVIDGKLEEIDAKGNSKTVDKDVTSLRGINTTDGQLYYIKSESVEIPYRNLIYDDQGKMSSYDQNRVDNNLYTYDKKELYYYADGKSTMICDEMKNIVWASSGVCMITQYEPIDNIKVAWSKADNSSWNGSINEERDDTVSWVIYYGGKAIGEYDEFCEISDFKSNKDQNVIYFIDRDVDGEDGTIYKTELTGKNAGVLEIVDDDAYESKLMYCAKEGLYYLREVDGNEGDLYLNDKKLASDVYNVVQVDADNQFIAVQQDYYDQDSTFTVSLLNKGKETGSLEDINYAEAAKDGTIVFLQNYNHNRREGDLVYYDGKRLKLIDDSTSSFWMRRGSRSIN